MYLAISSIGIISFCFVKIEKKSKIQKGSINFKTKKLYFLLINIEINLRILKQFGNSKLNLTNGLKKNNR